MTEVFGRGDESEDRNHARDRIEEGREQRAEIRNVRIQGASISSRISEHQELMKRIIRAKLKQNPHILKLLLDSGDTEIVHRPIRKDGAPYPDSTTIPERIFSGFLMELRKEF